MDDIRSTTIPFAEAETDCVDCGSVVPIQVDGDIEGAYYVPVPGEGHQDGNDVVCARCWEKRS